jgi:hypothetical protein
VAGFCGFVATLFFIQIRNADSACESYPQAIPGAGFQDVRVVAAIEYPDDDFAADAAGGAEDGELHRQASPPLGVYSFSISSRWVCSPR